MHHTPPGPRRAVRYRGPVDRPAQRIVIIVLAILLVVPIGALGLSGMLGRNEDPSATQSPTGPADPADNRPTMDPADQPPRPEIARPEAPAVMAVQTPEGAEATLAYLLESYTYMMTTGDTSVWEASTDPNCSVCMTFLDNARVLNDQGGYLVDGEFVVDSTSFQAAGDPATGGAPASGLATAHFTQAESTLVDDPTRQAIPLGSVTGQIQAQMLWDGQRWLIGDMTYLPAAGQGEGGGSAGGPSDGGA